MAPSEDEEDDYMSMVIAEPTQKESFTQRKRREQREVSSHITFLHGALGGRITNSFL